MFVGRKEQIGALSLLWSKRTSSLVTCRGRRRIGKSTLIEEFARRTADHFINIVGLSPRKGMTDRRQRMNFCEELADQTGGSIGLARNWTAAFRMLDERIPDVGRTVVLLDEISWMGSRNPDFAGYLKTAWDKRLKKHDNLILVLCGSVSSWIADNILDSTGFVGRDSLDIEVGELSLAECVKMLGGPDGHLSSREIFDFLSVTGGVPKYLEEIHPEWPFEENVRQLCFMPRGTLFREFNETFSEVFGKKVSSRGEVLRTLAETPLSVVEIARALGRKFVRMSLGGVKDEAEIRGHRRTYVGAMPGRIIYGLKNAGTINPVFLLDEIDKISSDIHGDPASALLEVLDPEQNTTFRDRYMEIPYDLSKVMFITTANTVDTIPAPLLDRMEVIELGGYTKEEKLEIAKQYLIPKQLKANGITDKKAVFTNDAITEIIESYTMEAGVRVLEREIGSVIRKVACKVAENKNTRKQIITKEKVSDYLGIKKYFKETPMKSDEIGTATGLAWTSVGGTTLAIEVSLMYGKGEILLTGKLGDVMKESARTAISYIRANADKYGIDKELFEKRDIHVHVPEGAIPKDGPSAGITIATAILSAFTGKTVKSTVAMTGEITLRGRVLAIGGLKEKALAAYRQGIKTVIIPKANLKDVTEIPKEIRKEIKFVLAENVTDVFKTAINF